MAKILREEKESTWRERTQRLTGKRAVSEERSFAEARLFGYALARLETDHLAIVAWLTGCEVLADSSHGLQTDSDGG